MTAEPIHDLAHIGHAELLTPFAQESLDFFTDLFGMEIEHREGQSVYLRGWGDYQRYSLKLTESQLPGIGHMAIRAWSPRRLQATCQTRSSTTGLGHRLDRRRPRARPRVPVQRSRRPPARALLRGRSLRAAGASEARAEERAAALRRPRRRGQAPGPRQPAGQGRAGESRRSPSSNSASVSTSRSSTTTAANRAHG